MKKVEKIKKIPKKRNKQKISLRSKKNITFNIVTAFPNLFDCFIKESLIKKAMEKKILKINIINLREYGIGKHKKIDDTIYGGGAGMLLRPDVINRAIRKVTNSYKIALSPKGEQYTQKTAKELTSRKNITLICGRYEGFDTRTLKEMDKVITIGPYITMGGEIPAMVIIESVSRLIQGVLGNIESIKEESFTDEGYLEYPLYTKPYNYKGKKVPKILLSGNHKKIKEWRNRHKKKIN